MTTVTDAIPNLTVINTSANQEVDVKVQLSPATVVHIDGLRNVIINAVASTPVVFTTITTASSTVISVVKDTTVFVVASHH